MLRAPIDHHAPLEPDHQPSPDLRVEDWIAAYLEADRPAANLPESLAFPSESPTIGERLDPTGRTERRRSTSTNPRADWSRFRLTRRRGITVLRLLDRELLRDDRVDELTTDLLDLIAAGHHRLVLDFARVERLTSRVVALIAEARRRCLSADAGALKVASLQPAIAELFHVSGLARNLPIHPDTADALDTLWPEPSGPRPLPVDVLSMIAASPAPARPATPVDADTPSTLPFPERTSAMPTDGLCLVAPSGRAVAVRGPRFLIGRDPSCALRPASPLVSRRHALIEHRDGQTWLVDLGTTNGTIHNGRTLRASAAPLAPGDHLEIGPLRLTVRLTPPATPDLDTLVTTWIAPESDEPTAELPIEPEEPAAAAQIQLRRMADTWVLTPPGPALDTPDQAEALRDALLQIPHDTTAPHVVVDLEFVSRLSGRAVGVLVGHHLRLTRDSGALRLTQAHPRVRALLDHLRLPDLIDYHDTLDNAVLTPWPDPTRAPANAE